MGIYDTKRELMELDIAISTIKNFGTHFVAYNTKFLGFSKNDEFYINGKSTRDAKSLNEICFGYDGEYKQLHILHVYQTKSGTKFAAIEILMGLYAFWSVSLE